MSETKTRKRFTLRMVGTATVRGSYVVVAESAAEARNIVMEEKLGDVIWEYTGLEAVDEVSIEEA